MDLRRSFDEVLQVCPKNIRGYKPSRAASIEEDTSPGQEVAQVDKFTVLLIFNIDDPPSIISPSDTLPVNHDCAFGADDCEGDHCL